MADPSLKGGSGLRALGSGQLPPAPNPQPTAIRQRVLIIGPSNIGDAILMSGVIAALHRRFPEAHLTLVVGTRAKALFAEDPRIHTLVDADAFGSLAGRFKLLWALWRYQPHVLVDLRHTLYPLVLAPWRVRRYLRQPPKAIVHMRERHLWKLSAQVPGLAPAGEDQSVWLSARDLAHVEGLRRRWALDPSTRSERSRGTRSGFRPTSQAEGVARSPVGLHGAQQLVIISPGARSHIKRWTAEGFARVADALIAQAHAQVIFSGEPDEEPIVEEILGLMQHRARSTVGLTTIRQLGVLMRDAALVITNDSATLHLASAFNVPTIAIFGPTDEAKYGPTASQSRVIRRRLFCAPCEAPQCRFNHECMRFISADEVFNAARDVLQQATSKRQQGKTETS